MNWPPANDFVVPFDCEKLEHVCAYGDLVKICPVGSSTIINPPCR